ncbi:hypothetical protein, partial [Acinetobacter baumannii]|uniref:hypothetical protein n=1 Tax=Acinetobacter baumannii TaxID=470 RepID=UPI001487C916
AFTRWKDVVNPEEWLIAYGVAANKYGKDVANYLTSPASVYLTKNDASSSMGIYQEITDPEMVSRFIGKPVALST